MKAEIPLVLQTAYAELVERAAAAQADGMAEEGEGAFTAKSVRGRRYWYFREPRTRRERYVGAETQELLERIDRHRAARREIRERQSLVAALTRSAALPRPDAELGRVLDALAEAGVFRRQAVLVGTVAFQTYSAMLGIRLGGAAVQTNDVDVAFDRTLGVAIDGKMPAMIEVLRGVDPRFRAIPHHSHSGRSVSFTNERVRLDFLTPNRGPDTETPAKVTALGVDAQPLRFLDFLIRSPEPAVVLHGPGVPVCVPSPERYAVHKLIVARRRPLGAAKSDKDLRQAAMLIDVLAEKRPFELRVAWDEAAGRGRKWAQLLDEGLALLDPRIRDALARLSPSA